MKWGRFDISAPVLGTFRLDGGAMFGSVPKAIWATRVPADADNCIALTTRVLLLRSADRTVLVDVGLGEKWADKQRKIFAIELTPRTRWGFDPAQVTDVILTHLHFDHAGGISRYDEIASGKNLVLCYPRARVHLQRANWENAQSPTPKEKASYLPENWQPLRDAKLLLCEGSLELLPDVWVHRVDGHTRGQQWIEVRAAEGSLVFPTDLVPTAAHLPVAFHMGYDNCAETILREKESFLSSAVEKDWIVVFEHDSECPAARIGRDERGHYCVRERVTI